MEGDSLAAQVDTVARARNDTGAMMTRSKKTDMLDWSSRGYHAIYREQQVNHCPGCGRTHWIIGRVSAECAFCSTALPLANPCLQPRYAPLFVHPHGRRDEPLAA